MLEIGETSSVEKMRNGLREMEALIINYLILMCLGCDGNTESRRTSSTRMSYLVTIRQDTAMSTTVNTSLRLRRLSKAALAVRNPSPSQLPITSNWPPQRMCTGTGLCKSRRIILNMQSTSHQQAIQSLVSLPCYRSTKRFHRCIPNPKMYSVGFNRTIPWTE